MEARMDRFGRRAENSDSPLIVRINQTFKRSKKEFSQRIDCDALICEKNDHPRALRRYQAVAPFTEIIANSP